jgi:hypothetical protein
MVGIQNSVNLDMSVTAAHREANTGSDTVFLFERLVKSKGRENSSSPQAGRSLSRRSSFPHQRA